MKLTMKMIVTNGSCLGEESSFIYDEETTFKHLKDHLVSKYGEKDIRIFIDEFGPQSLCSHAIIHIHSNKLRNSLMPSWCIPLSITNLGEDICIRVRYTGDQLKIVRIHKSDCVVVLKAMIEESTGVKREYQKLSFSGFTKNVKDSDRLEDLGVSSYSIIEVGQHVKGGRAPASRCSMVDTFNQSAEVHVPFDNTAPIWRTVSPGLCTIGICNNNNCNAFNQDVYCSHEMGPYDLIESHDRCPSCRSSIQALNIGFSDCFYTIRGVKADSNEEFRMQWTRIQSGFQTWDPASAGTCEWSLFQIVTRPLHSAHVPESQIREIVVRTENIPVTPNCAICFESLNPMQKVHVLTCGHSFHFDCFKKLKLIMQRNGNRLTCPLCRGPAS